MALFPAAALASQAYTARPAPCPFDLSSVVFWRVAPQIAAEVRGSRPPTHGWIGTRRLTHPYQAAALACNGVVGSRAVPTLLMYCCRRVEPYAPSTPAIVVVPHPTKTDCTDRQGRRAIVDAVTPCREDTLRADGSSGRLVRREPQSAGQRLDTRMGHTPAHVGRGNHCYSVAGCGRRYRIRSIRFRSPAAGV